MTEPVFKLLPTQTELLPVTKDASDNPVRPVRTVVSSPNRDRMDDIIVQEGIDFSTYKSTNPVVLFNHDPKLVVARAPDIAVVNGKTVATALFPAEGVDKDSDYVYGKIKAGLINAASIGFNPIAYEPIDPKQPWGGLKYLRSECLEFSFCAIPANKDCVIIGRSLYFCDSDEHSDADQCRDFEGFGIRSLSDIKAKGFELIQTDRLRRIMAVPGELRAAAGKTPAGGARGLCRRHANVVEKAIRGETAEWKCGAARTLPLDMAASWDASAAAARLLDAAGFDGDEPDVAKARKGFLAFDALNPTLRSSYKLPFADIIGGEMKAVAAGVAAAAARASEFPQASADEARQVLGGYQTQIENHKATFAPEFKDLAERRLRLLKASA